MQGLDIKMTCKSCGQHIYKSISIAETFKINSISARYVKVICPKCGKINYIASSNNTIEDKTKMSVLESNISYLVGGNEKAMKAFKERLGIVNKEERVLLESEVHTIQSEGITQF